MLPLQSYQPAMIKFSHIRGGQIGHGFYLNDKKWHQFLDSSEILIPTYSIWVIGIRTGKKVPKCHFFLKVRSWYGRIKAKIDIILNPSILSQLGKLSQTKFQVLGAIQGAHHTPKVGCFFKIFKIQFFCRFITKLVKILQQWSLYDVIEDILPRGGKSGKSCHPR